MNSRRNCRGAGFTLIEILTAMAIFLLICAAAFSLLTVSQRRYGTETQVLNSFQEARLAMDQMVRDINDAGYPQPLLFQIDPANPGTFAQSPFAWLVSQGYPTTPCTIGVNCAPPGDFDLIIETNIDPVENDAAPNTNKVEWIRYKLDNETLYRAVVTKPDTAADPVSSTDGALVPLVQNVVNNAPAAEITQFQTYYPGMFPGGAPVSLFSYTCDAPTGTLPCWDTAGGAINDPRAIRGVNITLIVKASLPDAQTGKPRLILLSGQGRRLNPSE